MVSTDRRSLRYKRSIKIKDFDFDEAIKLRPFNGQDVVQIKFEDELAFSDYVIKEKEKTFVSLKCSELPLDI